MIKKYILIIFVTILTLSCELLEEAPTAKIVSSDTSVVNTAIELDGTASSDTGGKALSYKWELINKPVGSYLNFRMTTSDTLSKIRVTPELVGVYTFKLTVDNGYKTHSVTKEINVTYSDLKEITSSIFINIDMDSSWYQSGISSDMKTYILVESVDASSSYLIEPILGALSYKYEIGLPDNSYNITCFTDKDYNKIFSSTTDLWGKITNIDIPTANGRDYFITISQQ